MCKYGTSWSSASASSATAAAAAAKTQIVSNNRIISRKTIKTWTSQVPPETISSSFKTIQRQGHAIYPPWSHYAIPPISAKTQICGICYAYHKMIAAVKHGLLEFWGQRAIFSGGKLPPSSRGYVPWQYHIIWEAIFTFHISHTQLCTVQTRRNQPMQ